MRHLTAEDPDWLRVVHDEVIDGAELRVGCDGDEARFLAWPLGCGEVAGHGDTWFCERGFGYGVVLDMLV